MPSRTGSDDVRSDRPRTAARRAAMGPPNEVVTVSGSPPAGTPLMNEEPRIGTERPLRMPDWDQGRADDRQHNDPTGTPVLRPHRAGRDTRRHLSLRDAARTMPPERRTTPSNPLPTDPPRARCSPASRPAHQPQRLARCKRPDFPAATARRIMREVLAVRTEQDFPSVIARPTRGHRWPNRSRALGQRACATNPARRPRSASPCRRNGACG